MLCPGRTRAAKGGGLNAALQALCDGQMDDQKGAITRAAIVTFWLGQ